MDDRTLLELAAKAAGIDIKPMEINNRLIAFMAPPKQCPRGLFNPIEDDGDALRLAVNLGMNIVRGYFAVTAEIPPEAENDPGVSEDWPYADDPYAATRRAIVRAAAEIGKAMK